MLYRAIKYQVDKGPVDAVTGKAKRTLNDSHLLREDIDYTSMVQMLSFCFHTFARLSFCVFCCSFHPLLFGSVKLFFRFVCLSVFLILGFLVTFIVTGR